MLILLHGQIFLFIPAAGCLCIAGMLVAYVWRGKRAGQQSPLVMIALLLGILIGLIGLVALIGFLDEFRYWVEYNVQSD